MPSKTTKKVLDPAAITAMVNVANSSRDRSNRAAVAGYLDSLPHWPPPENTTETPGNTVEEPNRPGPDGAVLSCTTTPYNLVTSPDTIVVFQPDVETLWPGALIQGKSLKGIGSYLELPIRKRAPIPLTINLLVTPNTITVERPSSSTVTEAIAKLIEPIEGTVDFGSDLSYKVQETYTLEQAMLKLGLAVNSPRFDFKAKHSAATSAEKSVISASLIQKHFTVSVENPTTPVDFFSRDFSLDDLMDQVRRGRIDRENLPVFLSNVSYGRMLYVTISSKKSLSELHTALSLSVSAGTGGGNTELDDTSKMILNTAELSVSAIGIEDAAASALIKAGKIQEFFSAPMNIRSVRPISYIFRNLSDLSIAALTTAAEYNITVCTPEAIGADVIAHSEAVKSNLNNYYNFVLSAISQRNDPPSRHLRIGQYRGYHAEVVANLDWLSRRRVDDLKIQAWVKRWALPIFEEIDRHARVWQNGRAQENAFFNIGEIQIYDEALAKSAEQSLIVGLLAGTITIPPFIDWIPRFPFPWTPA